MASYDEPEEDSDRSDVWSVLMSESEEVSIIRADFAPFLDGLFSLGLAEKMYIGVKERQL